jgi:hypothetical protein
MRRLVERGEWKSAGGGLDSLSLDGVMQAALDRDCLSQWHGRDADNGSLIIAESTRTGSHSRPRCFELS